ncbi:hypothetical protein T459_15407 [Capsicum annuum]|uniref:Bifunctional epoxide hydrolase 2-like n=1 Tax=Capsicum annuum TaxID=4072 RepID=A0A2G2ZK74_CAPAN|nr:hypothetical protein T459_15407 [Capsicum annuum]
MAATFSTGITLPRAVAISIYFLMADTSRSPQSKKLVKKLYVLAGIFQFLSMLAVVIAFATGAQVKVPTKFIVGEFDLVYRISGAKECIHNGRFKKDVPLLEEVVAVEGAAHFVNQERPDEINKHIYDFIQKF